MDEKLLTERFQHATRRAPGEREGCPSAEELSRFAEGALEGARREEVLDHLALCHDCSVEVRTALSLRDWSRKTGGTRPSRGAISWSGLAAAAALVVGLSSFLFFSAQEPTSRYRDAETGAISSLVDEDRPLSRDDFRLRWSPGPEGSRYHLRVTDEDLRLVYRARGLEAPEHRVPESALEEVPSGARLLWQVEVLEPSGDRTTSPGFFARVQ